MIAAGFRFRCALTGLLLSSCGFAVTTTEAQSAAAAQASPTYSATGVCVNGAPEFEFSISGLPANQENAVGFLLFDGPETGGSSQILLDGSSANILWNVESPDFPPGSVNGIAVGFPGTPNNPPPPRSHLPIWPLGPTWGPMSSSIT